MNDLGVIGEKNSKELVKDFKVPSFLTKVLAVCGIFDGTFRKSVGSLRAFIRSKISFHLL